MGRCRNILNANGRSISRVRAIEILPSFQGDSATMGHQCRWLVETMGTGLLYGWSDDHEWRIEMTMMSFGSSKGTDLSFVYLDHCILASGRRLS